MTIKNLERIKKEVLDHGHECTIEGQKLKIGIVWYNDETKETDTLYEYASTSYEAAIILGY